MSNSDRFNKFVNPFVETFEKNGVASFVSFRPIPSIMVIEAIIEDFMDLLYPGRSGNEVLNYKRLKETVSQLLNQIGHTLERQIFLAWYHENPLNLADEMTKPYEEMASNVVERLFEALPTMRKMMKEDALAAFEGDPAATSVKEAILSYPGVRALTIHRISHFLYQEKVPLIPRMISEIIHKQTGIDIHPGATIGRCLFIDHGTGVVIGETAIIGNRVKLYQGVTLGALSTREGQKMAGKKRHPTVEDNVTIYSGATILGGATIIGENSVIGGNAFIIESIPKNTKVSIKTPELNIRLDKKTT